MTADRRASSPAPRAARFHALFARAARRVRARLALRHALTGAAFGLVLAAALAAFAWRTRRAELRRVAPALALLGAAAGLAGARRARWNDTDVALYLDDRLETREAIATAVELRGDEDDARAVVLASAADALATSRAAPPALFRPAHALAPAAVIALALVARAPLPPAPAAPPPPGSARVQMTRAEGLEKIAALARLGARDDAQRARLDAIAKDAERLREELRTGLEKREAQDRLARIEDAIAAERLSLGDGEKRAGLESAVGKLAESELTKRAANALGDHDLESMDAELEKLANQREKADRELAKRTLEDAANAAKSAGAPDVGKELEEQQGLMDRRGARADVLRELADAMKDAGEASDETRTESEALDRKGTDAAARKLAASMAEALAKLTPEERKRLAEKMRQKTKQPHGGSGADADQMKDMADQLSTPEGKKKLEDELRALADDDTEGDEAKREEALGDAQRGAEDTEKGLGGDGDSSGKQGGNAGGAQAGNGVPVPSGGDKSGAGGAGSHHDEGAGEHAGKTDPVDAQTLKSRAKGPMNKSAAMPGSVTTYTQGKAGGTANTRGTGDLRVVGPSEVDGVERSDVPEEYREHVRQYFQP